MYMKICYYLIFINLSLLGWFIRNGIINRKFFKFPYSLNTVLFALHCAVLQKLSCFLFALIICFF